MTHGGIPKTLFQNTRTTTTTLPQSCWQLFAKNIPFLGYSDEYGCLHEKFGKNMLGFSLHSWIVVKCITAQFKLTFYMLTHNITLKEFHEGTNFAWTTFIILCSRKHFANQRER